MIQAAGSVLARNDSEAAASFLQQLHQRHPGRILETVLFGSKARGDSHPGSDIDILVVVDSEDWRFHHDISTLAAGISLEFDVLISPRVIGRERWKQRGERGSILYRNIVAEGIPATAIVVGTAQGSKG